MVSERIRFHLDEHIDTDIARTLRRYGIDVTTTVEAGLRTRSDETQWQFIWKEQRVIVTHDKDFLIIASSTSEHPGIAYCRHGTRSIGEMIESLILIYEVFVPADMIGRVEFL